MNPVIEFFRRLLYFDMERFLPRPIIRETAARVLGVPFFGFILYRQCTFLRLSQDWEDILAWFLLASTYLLYMLAFATRRKAAGCASRPVEFIVPAIVCAQPYVLHSAYVFNRDPDIVPLLASLVQKFAWFFELHEAPAPWLSRWLIVIGAAIFMPGTFNLLRSFSIFADARKPVTKGLYRFVRHPLYLGESIWMLGLALKWPSPVGYLAAGTFIVGLRIRASIEEGKIIEHFPKYAEYKARTGAYWPRFGKL